MKRYIIAALMVLVLASTTQAKVWYVHPDSTLNSIQTALNACNTNDIVIVGAGTYYEHITWPATQGIRLISEYGPDTTLIDGSGTGRTVYFNGVFDTTTLIMGFKLTNGYSDYGGAIRCINYASPKIAGNIIVGNESTIASGGIHCSDYASPIIVNNTVRNNIVEVTAGGIGVVFSGSPNIVSNIVSGNLSDDESGGIGFGDGSEPSAIGNFVFSNSSMVTAGIGARNTGGPITDNVIFNNSADSAGGIGIQNCSSLISENVIVNNLAAIGTAGGIGMKSSSPAIEYCCIANNTGEGVGCMDNSTPTIHYCDIIDNAGYALLNVSTVTIDAENNWWGHASGPYHSTNPSGQGDTVSDYVDFDPWGTYPSCPVTVWYVHPDSTLNSIQTALNACNTNDIVIVGAGTYYEHITWPSTQGIRLVSEYGPDTTIIDGSGTGRPITLDITLDTTTMIMGFKITNGYSDFGGAIFCSNDASPTIANNIIVGNESTVASGGIHCQGNASPIIIHNTVRNNIAHVTSAGIGVVLSGYPAIVSNTVAGNQTYGAGTHGTGGIGFGDGAEPSVAANFVLSNSGVHAAGIGARSTSGPIVDNVVFNNHADSIGGGIGMRYCYSVISGNTIVKNTSSLSKVGGIGMENSSPMIEGCYIADNTGDGIYCEVNSEPVIHYCDIINNDGYALRNTSTVTINAENNWWGDATGPYHPDSNPGGLGDTVSDYVDFDPWLPGPGVLETEELLIENQQSRIIMPTILNGSTLPITVRQRCEMSIKLYDLVGRECWSEENVTYESGSHTIDLPILSNGIYFIKFAADEQQETRKLLFVK
jgi:hypothetical protein